MRTEPRTTPQPAADVIRDLARQMRKSEDEVEVVFNQQIAALESDAKVTIYLTILARRRTRDLLRK